MQENFKNLEKWSQKWLLRFNSQKYCFYEDWKNKRAITSVRDREELREVHIEKDLKLVINTNLNFKEHLAVKIIRVNIMVGVNKRKFITLD